MTQIENPINEICESLKAFCRKMHEAHLTDPTIAQEAMNEYLKIMNLQTMLNLYPHLVWSGLRHDQIN